MYLNYYIPTLSIRLKISAAEIKLNLTDQGENTKTNTLVDQFCFLRNELVNVICMVNISVLVIAALVEEPPETLDEDICRGPKFKNELERNTIQKIKIFASLFHATSERVF